MRGAWKIDSYLYVTGESVLGGVPVAVMFIYRSEDVRLYGMVVVFAGKTFVVFSPPARNSTFIKKTG